MSYTDDSSKRAEASLCFKCNMAICAPNFVEIEVLDEWPGPIVCRYLYYHPHCYNILFPPETKPTAETSESAAVTSVYYAPPIKLQRTLNAKDIMRAITLDHD